MRELCGRHPGSAEFLSMSTGPSAASWHSVAAVRGAHRSHASMSARPMPRLLQMCPIVSMQNDVMRLLSGDSKQHCACSASGNTQIWCRMAWHSRSEVSETSDSPGPSHVFQANNSCAHVGGMHLAPGKPAARGQTHTFTVCLAAAVHCLCA